MDEDLTHDNEYEGYEVFLQPINLPDLDAFLEPLNFVQDPEPQIPQPLPEPQPQPQPEMMVHLADLNPVIELYEVLPVAGFPHPPLVQDPEPQIPQPYPPLAYQRRSEGAYADVESLALFTAFHLNDNVPDMDTLRDMFPYILGLRDNNSLNTKLRNSRNSAALHLIELLTLVPPVVVIPPAHAGGNQAAGH